MESLLRTRAGSFDLSTALTLNEVEKVRDEGRLDDIIVKVDELFDYQKLHMKESADKAVHNGNVFHVNDTSEGVICKYALVYDSSNVFIGIYEYFKNERRYKPYKMFL